MVRWFTPLVRDSLGKCLPRDEKRKANALEKAMEEYVRRNRRKLLKKSVTFIAANVEPRFNEANSEGVLGSVIRDNAEYFDCRP